MKNTETTAQASLLPRRQGISYAVVALIFAVGSGAIAFAILGDLQGNLGSMTGSERLEILDVNAYMQDHRLVITGNVKNLGSSGMSSITIDELSAGNLVITQAVVINDGSIEDGHGTMTIQGLGDDGATGFSETPLDRDASITARTTLQPGHVDHGTNTANNTFAFGASGDGATATVALTGISIDEDDLVGLPAGASQSFRIVVTGVTSGSSQPDVLDIGATVPASEDLYISLTGTDGTTTTISDPRSDRVTRR